MVFGYIVVTLDARLRMHTAQWSVEECTSKQVSLRSYISYVDSHFCLPIISVISYRVNFTATGGCTYVCGFVDVACTRFYYFIIVEL